MLHLKQLNPNNCYYTEGRDILQPGLLRDAIRSNKISALRKQWKCFCNGCWDGNPASLGTKHSTEYFPDNLNSKVEMGTAERWKADSPRSRLPFRCESHQFSWCTSTGLCLTSRYKGLAENLLPQQIRFPCSQTSLKSSLNVPLMRLPLIYRPKYYDCSY